MENKMNTNSSGLSISEPFTEGFMFLFTFFSYRGEKINRKCLIDLCFKFPHKVRYT